MKTLSLRLIWIGIALWAIPVGAQTLNVSIGQPGGITGGGNVVGPGISCPSDCSETYLPIYIGLRPRPTTPQSVLLVANPTPGFFFVRWTGACSGQGSFNDARCTLTVPPEGANVSAVFGKFGP